MNKFNPSSYHTAVIAWTIKQPPLDLRPLYTPLGMCKLHDRTWDSFQHATPRDIRRMLYVIRSRAALYEQAGSKCGVFHASLDFWALYDSI